MEKNEIKPKSDPILSKFKKNRDVVQNELKASNIDNSNINKEETTNENIHPILSTDTLETLETSKTTSKNVKKLNDKKYLLSLTSQQKETLETMSYVKSMNISNIIKIAVKSHYNLSDEEF